MMNPARKQIWLDALRSGKFEQGRGCLVNSGKYCCLGVALKVLKDWREDPGLMCSMISPICDDDWQWQVILLGEGLPKEHIGTLSRMNDTGSTFKEIADWIEEQKDI